MSFNYSVFTVMMPEFDIAESAELLQSLGYDGVEWRVHSVPSQFPEKPDFWRSNRATIDMGSIVERAPEIRRISEDAGLEIVGLGTYLGFKLTDDVARCMEAAQIMGCKRIRVSPPNYDGSTNYNDLYEEALDGFGRIEELARAYGVRANIEIHHGNMCSSASLTYRLVSNFDPDYIGVIFDPGNMICEGHEKWQLGLELLGPYLSHVHVKNAAWVESNVTDEGEKRWKHSMVATKDGFVDWTEVLLALDKVGYSGWLSFEDFSPGDTESKLANNISYLKGLVNRLGL
jgi:sugar phosphate isomerase/epimerase